MEPVRGLVAVDRTTNEFKRHLGCLRKEGMEARVVRKAESGPEISQLGGRRAVCWADGLFCSKMFKVKGHSLAHFYFTQRVNGLSGLFLDLIVPFL